MNTLVATDLTGVATEAVIKEAFMSAFMCSLSNAKSGMKEKGFIFKTQGKKYIMYKFSGKAAALPVMLKSVVVAT